MFFICDDKPQAFEWEEQGRPCSQYDLQLSCPDLIPYLYPFVLIELAVVYSYMSAEMLLQPANDLGGERYFGQQV